MLQSYFVIAYRNLFRNKVFSFINVAGLSLGIACCSMLVLYIQSELSYDMHFDGSDRIYRVTTEIRQGEAAPEILQRTSPPVAMTMLEEFPEIESATRVVSPPEVEQHLIRYGTETFYEKTGFLVDSTFLRVFSFELAQGNPRTALNERASVILSHQLAEKLFGQKGGLNETLIITSGFSVDTFRVTGVLEPMVKKSHLNAGFYMSMDSEGWGDLINGMTTWSGQNFIFSYVKLRPGALMTELTAKFPALQERHGGDEMRAMKRFKSLGLQPLTDIHLHSDHFDYNVDLGPNGSIKYIYVIGSVAVFILLIACINFMNLTTAKATQRAGEVGVRKTMGAQRSELIKQFLGESATIVVIAIVVSVGLVQIAVPLFNSLTGGDLAISLETLPVYAGALLTVGIVTALVAGSYPAFFLSSFHPARILKGKNPFTGSSTLLRKGLVVLQFVIAITLIGSSIVIRQQLTFIQSKDLGFRAESVAIVPLRTPEAKEEYGTLRDDLAGIAGVKSITAATSLPSTPLLRDMPLYKEGEDMNHSHHHYVCNIEEGYFDLLNIPLISGRNLTRDRDVASENNIRVVVNRASIRSFGIEPEHAAGNKLMFTGRRNGENTETTFVFEIVGVVEDYHHTSLHSSIDPVVYMLPESNQNYLFMAIETEAAAYQQTLAQISETWNKRIMATPFESHLLSESIHKKYEHDRRVSLVLSIFTAIAIGISCMGLYGLSVFVGERRLKEIGVRKVLGASTINIIGMLSREFLVLVTLAFILSVPSGMFAMTYWLQSFAYRIDPGIVTFALAGALSFLIAWLTVGFEAIRAASGNPVDSLKNN